MFTSEARRSEKRIDYSKENEMFENLSTPVKITAPVKAKKAGRAPIQLNDALKSLVAEEGWFQQGGIYDAKELNSLIRTLRNEAKKNGFRVLVGEITKYGEEVLLKDIADGPYTVTFGTVGKASKDVEPELTDSEQKEIQSLLGA